MSHAPPVPDAAKAPWPAHPAPIEKAATDAAPEEPATPVSARTMTRIGVGAAIGSAAIAAALLYVNHGRRK